MVTTRSRTAALRDKPRPPMPSPYTFVDEMWRTRTVTNPRYFSHAGGKNSPPKPTRPAPCYIMGDPRPRDSHTIAEAAEEDDLQLWVSSASVADYEERKQALNERKPLDREAFVNAQGQFHKFPALPLELRVMIWKLALEEPVTVTLRISYWRPRPRPGRSRCGILRYIAEDYSATAVLPPLMLVNHESHRTASAHYKRAFRGVKGNGGVLAAYPTILRTTQPCEMIGPDDRQLVQEFVLG
ncbi:hypothetical protein F5X97DRAFT_312720 [Nemania serpens]|nr:hypothetical protein F5X97DRAFT_312720 [Nemania serpens]